MGTPSRTWIGENDLIHARGRRVPVIGCLQVRLDHGPDIRDAVQEGKAHLLGVLLGLVRLFSLPLEYQGHLPGQLEHHVLN